jgi:hypothetical protein
MARTVREVKKLHRKRGRRLKERRRHPQVPVVEAEAKEEEKPAPKRAPRRKKEKARTDDEGAG